MFGDLECGGIGTPVAPVSRGPLPATLQQQCLEHNRALIASLREDQHADALLEFTRADAELGRMSVPVPGACLENVNSCLFSLSFCVQSTSATWKPRCCTLGSHWSRE